MSFIYVCYMLHIHMINQVHAKKHAVIVLLLICRMHLVLLTGAQTGCTHLGTAGNYKVV